jgi:hypothetical protein
MARSNTNPPGEEEDRMSHRDEMSDRVPGSRSVAQALAELIGESRAQARDLERLVCLVEVEQAAAHQREADRAARLGEVRAELADAVVALEIETGKRIEAEQVTAELRTAVDQIGAILASLPTTGTPVARAPEPSGAEEAAGEIPEATQSHRPVDIDDLLPGTISAIEAPAGPTEKNRVLAGELEGLICCVEAEQAASVSAVRAELADAVVALEIETEKRIDAEPEAAELPTVVDQGREIPVPLAATGALFARTPAPSDADEEGAGEIPAARSQRPVEMASCIPGAIGVAAALAELIEKNRAQARELGRLLRLVEAEQAAIRHREAEQAARLGEARAELADAVAAVEIETGKRIAARQAAAELRTAVDRVAAILASLPMTRTSIAQAPSQSAAEHRPLEIAAARED